MKNSVLMISLLFFSFDIYGWNNIAPPAKYMSPNALSRLSIVSTITVTSF